MIHIRRCHICSKTSESETIKIERCDGCGKYLAPFLFCSDPTDSVPLKSSTEATIHASSNPSSYLKPEYPPIYGISLYW
ncbi:MAG: hypothetical protein H7235_11110 [Bdellovibrionaceae bacterium]|nr:hypothetical protein [Pseudobdellovibrionaceae bacterium]